MLDERGVWVRYPGTEMGVVHFQASRPTMGDRLVCNVYMVLFFSEKRRPGCNAGFPSVSRLRIHGVTHRKCRHSKIHKKQNSLVRTRDADGWNENA